jgi:hypothetical protein
MNLLHADFQELYRRHLCRHSQFGINVLHVVSVVGTYLALFSLIYALVPTEWLVVAFTLPQLLLLAFNIPFGVFLINGLLLASILGVVFALPQVFFLWYLPVLVLFHQVQVWSHRIYTRETDMTQFNNKYRKGFALSLLLSVYELPILVNYLFFGRKDWCA